MIRRENNTLMVGTIAVDECVEKFGTPLYVYDIDTIHFSIKKIQEAIEYKSLKIFFACMANNNISLLQEIKKCGIGIFVSSVGELYLAAKAGFKSDDIITTCSNLSVGEISEILKNKIIVNADSLEQLKQFVAIGKLKKIGIRITPNISFPTDIINVAIGPSARTGILEDSIKSVLRDTLSLDVKISGLHMYVGTNILDYKSYLLALDRLFMVAKEIPSLEYLDIGGGFGVSYQSFQQSFDWKGFGQELVNRMNELNDKLNRQIELFIEPGRSIVADSAVLITKVVEIKKHNGQTFIGTDTNLSNFPRSYIYNQFHNIEIVNDAKGRNYVNNSIVCGNSVASKDFLSGNIKFPEVKDGDLLAIQGVGAYGYSMSSNFCGKLKPPEIMIKNGRMFLIRERETYEDLLKGQNYSE